MSKAGQRVISMLRQMILSEELKGGSRIAEIPTAERLGVSRTPVRIAFRSLEQEGLLIKLEGRGYRVREVTQAELYGAVEVRGTLEGLAARQAAENGLTVDHRKTLMDCLYQGDALFDKGYLNEEDIETYHELNRRFHSVILEASCNPAISSALQRNEHLPFASVNSLAFDRSDLKAEYRRFFFAHMQHRTVFDAIDRQQGARAEATMREHANSALRYPEMLKGMTESDNKLRILSSER